MKNMNVTKKKPGELLSILNVSSGNCLSKMQNPKKQTKNQILNVEKDLDLQSKESNSLINE